MMSCSDLCKATGSQKSSQVGRHETYRIDVKQNEVPCTKAM